MKPGNNFLDKMLKGLDLMQNKSFCHLMVQRSFGNKLFLTIPLRDHFFMKVKGVIKKNTQLSSTCFRRFVMFANGVFRPYQFIVRMTDLFDR